MKRPMLFVALDGMGLDEAKTRKTLQIAHELHRTGLPFGFKVNLDYVLEYGVEFAVNEFSLLEGRELFVDLKMWNGKRTMAAVLRKLSDLEVTYVTVHALADTELAKAIAESGKLSPKVAATTVLTHYSEEYCQEHFGRSRRNAVVHFANIAVRRNGCQAIVLPGQYLDDVRHLDVEKIVPGLREEGSFHDGRHEVEVTPTFAKEHHADVLVCGSPIMANKDPAAALRRILSAIA